jgi:predicted nucleic-acid-binding protein
VLHRRFEYPMSDIVAMLKVLLAADNLFIEYTEELDALINGEDETKGDLADHLIAWSAAKAGCSKTITFDHRAAKAVPGMELLQ